MGNRLVRLPRTAPRNASYTFAKLLARVEKHRSYGGFSAFVGSLVRPGAVINEHELWPSDEYPAKPVLIECAGPVPRSGRGHHRSPCLWLLWQYEREERRWEELCRAQAHDWTWFVDLLPVAERALAQGQAEPPPADCYAIADRITATMDTELKPLEMDEKARVLCVLESSVAARLVRLQD